MATKKIVIEMPTMDTILGKIESFIRNLADDIKDKIEDTCDCDDDEREWDKGIPLGTAPDKNKRFGAGFEIDEPRAEDYSSPWKFYDDHAAFDRFVDAGEDCVARGLEKTSSAPITKVKAIRKRVGDLPPMNTDIIGETNWWEDDDSWF